MNLKYIVTFLLITCFNLSDYLFVNSFLWNNLRLKSASKCWKAYSSLSDIEDITLEFITKSSNGAKTTDSEGVTNVEKVICLSGLINSWKLTLYHGYLPEISNESMWPDSTLLERLYFVMIQLNLPMLTRRHSELIPSVIRSVLDLLIEYYNKLPIQKDEDSKTVEESNQNEIEYYINQNQQTIVLDSNTSSEHSTKEELMESLVNQFQKAWEPPLSGLSSLDELYGYDHGLLSFHSDQTINSNTNDLSNDMKMARSSGAIDQMQGKAKPTTSTNGFGLFDSVWKHTGWKSLRNIQNNLKDMKELKDLLRLLGKRPSVQGRDLKTYPPQYESTKDKSPLGVARSSYSPTETTGVKKSDQLEGLLPCEAMLLSSSAASSSAFSSSISDVDNTAEVEEVKVDTNRNHHRRRKLLFLAKRAEKLLSSYERTGWIDEYSLPTRRKTRHQVDLPVVTGGPIIICLDTSWSMLGSRENLAKAVVLESSVIASKHNRPCYVIAFSGPGSGTSSINGVGTSDSNNDSNNIKECSLPLGVNNKKDFMKLLEFLSHSFHGGTDVTTALLASLALIQTSNEWKGADIILVTDGELQSPPVSQDVFHMIERLEREQGLLIHGLLVGKPHSEPLELLCSDQEHAADGSRVYDFLYKYDPLTLLQRQLYERQLQTQSVSDEDTSSYNNNNYDDFMSIQSSLHQQSNSHHTTTILSSSSVSQSQQRAAKQSKQGIRSSSSREQRSMELYMSASAVTAGQSAEEVEKVKEVDINTMIESIIANTTNNLYKSTYGIFSANTTVNTTASQDDRNPDLTTARSGTSYSVIYDQIANVIHQLREGLVERDTEVRLLVLSVLCREHILLLGAPGTGKSDLARRLACVIDMSSANSTDTDTIIDDSKHNNYFERLLTKYTNPEELFGPLSLRALEQDEYQRNTAGYLPTASIAFLDEIFKSNSAILNSLLTILNERKFDNGNKRVSIPLLAVVAASNELPESEELDALYDRFLFRKQVYSVSDASLDELFQVLSTTDDSNLLVYTDTDTHHNNHKNKLKLTSQLIDSLHQQLSRVQLSSSVTGLLKQLRVYLREENDPSIYLSDRRLIKIVNMLKIVSIAHNRKIVSVIDCLLLSHVLWSDPVDQSRIADYLYKHVVPPTGSKGLIFLLDTVIMKLIKYYQDNDTSDAYLYGDSSMTTNNNNKVVFQKLQRESIFACVFPSQPPPPPPSSTNNTTIISSSNSNSLLSELNTINQVLVDKIAYYEVLLTQITGTGTGTSSPAAAAANVVIIDLPEPNIFLSPTEQITMRQQLTPRVKTAILELRRLFYTTSTIFLTLTTVSPQNQKQASRTLTQYDANPLTTSVFVDDIWSKYKNGQFPSLTNTNTLGDKSSSSSFFMNSDDREESMTTTTDGDDDDVLTNTEKSYSKKKAQKSLSSQKFKLWKKLQKNKNNDNDDMDE